MLNSIKKALGLGPEVDYATMAKDGAVIIDVRSPGEYASGHIRGSINIPVDRLNSSPAGLPRKEKVIITCCASGMRSATAKGILERQGYQTVFNGGSWSSLKNKITK